MRTVRILVPVAAATTVGVLPAFLIGSQGVQLSQDLAFDSVALGLAVAMSWATASLASAALGRWSERIGGGRALRIAAITSATSMLGVAAFARTWLALAIGAAVGGLANALAQPSANLLITRTVGPARHGIAFAVKQSAIPLATLLGGFAVPVITLTIGWRWTFAAGGLLAVVAAVAVPTHEEDGGTDAASDDAAVGRGHASSVRARLIPLICLALGVGFGAAAAGGMTSFLTSASVAAGIGEGAAGLLLMVCSGVGIGVRLAMGARADRHGTDQLPVVAVMMGVGAVAMAALARQTPLTFLVATPVAFGAGWAWPGLFNLSVVRDFPDAPGAATGVTQTGTYLGAALGPLAFGVLVDHASYASAWLLGAAFLVVGAGATLIARARLGRSRPNSTQPVIEPFS